MFADVLSLTTALVIIPLSIVVSYHLTTVFIIPVIRLSVHPVTVQKRKKKSVRNKHIIWMIDGLVDRSSTYDRCSMNCVPSLH